MERVDLELSEAGRTRVGDRLGYDSTAGFSCTEAGEQQATIRGC
jgi:hypothetical protein